MKKHKEKKSEIKFGNSVYKNSSKSIHHQSVKTKTQAKATIKEQQDGPLDQSMVTKCNKSSKINTKEEPNSSKSNIIKMIICKGPCKKRIYTSTLFLNHISRAKNCRLKYSADEIYEIQTKSQLKVDVAPNENQVRFSKTRTKVKATKRTTAYAQGQSKKRIKLEVSPTSSHWFEWGNTVHQIVAMPYIFTIDLKLVNFNRKRLFEGFNNIKAAARSYQGYMKVKTTEAQTKFNFWHIFASVNAKWVVYTLKSLIICS